MSHLRGLNTIHIIGIGPEDALGVVLRKAFDNVLYFPDKTLPFTNTPSLYVDIGTSETLIGPLTLSNRAGCWRCAFERITAARALSEPAAEPEPLPSRDEISEKITPVLIRE